MTTLTPSVGQPIRSLQNLLRIISFHYSDIPPIIPDGLYGSQTAESVRQFQKKFDFPVTGEVDHETWNKIVEIYSRIKSFEPRPISPYTGANLVLGHGHSHPVMYIIQAMLRALADEYINIQAPPFSGVNDSDTVSAVKYLQRLCGIPDDGIINSLFWNELAFIFSDLIRKI